MECEIDENSSIVSTIIEWTTYVPIRAIIERLAVLFVWDNNEKKALIEVNGKKLKLNVNNSSNATRVIRYRTIVPIRYVSENLGYSVDWNSTEKNITTSY